MSIPGVELDGVTKILAERVRQQTDEGYHVVHDDSHDAGELALAAVAYAIPPERRDGEIPTEWPWGGGWWKPAPEEDGIAGRIRDLQKAGALIAAEIDRLNRRLAEIP